MKLSNKKASEILEQAMKNVEYELSKDEMEKVKKELKKSFKLIKTNTEFGQFKIKK